MKKTLELLTIVASAVSLMNAAFAAESATTLTVPSSPVPPAVGTSETTVKPSAPNPLLEKLYFNYFATYHGASLDDMGANYTLDHMGKRTTSPNSRINFDGDVTAAYLVTKNIGIGAYIPFLLVPAPGQHFVLGDVGAKIFDRHTVTGGGFNLATNLMIQAPTNDYSKLRGMDLALKTTPSIRYNIPHSNFAVGSWTEMKAYLGVNFDKTFKLWAGPYVSYNFSDSFALNVEYEMEADHYKNKPTFDFTNYQTDLMPGVVWNITPRFMVNPYVQLFTGNKVTLENSALGAVINARFL
jgi:opacity protein-like surface antigen